MSGSFLFSLVLAAMLRIYFTHSVHKYGVRPGISSEPGWSSQTVSLISHLPEGNVWWPEGSAPPVRSAPVIYSIFWAGMSEELNCSGQHGQEEVWEGLISHPCCSSIQSARISRCSWSRAGTAWPTSPRESVLPVQIRAKRVRSNRSRTVNFRLSISRRIIGRSNSLMPQFQYFCHLNGKHLCINSMNRSFRFQLFSRGIEIPTWWKTTLIVSRFSVEIPAKTIQGHWSSRNGTLKWAEQCNLIGVQGKRPVNPEAFCWTLQSP